MISLHIRDRHGVLDTKKGEEVAVIPVEEVAIPVVVTENMDIKKEKEKGNLGEDAGEKKEEEATVLDNKINIFRFVLKNFSVLFLKIGVWEIGRAHV